MNHKLNLRSVIATVICLAGVAVFAGCKKNDDKPAHIAVTNITGVPVTAVAGTPLTLTGTVNPDNATYKTIVWSVVSAGGTGANISGNTLTTTATGTVEIRASITGGGATASVNYTESFSITVMPFGGNGSSGTPYLITNVTDLRKMSELINAGTSPYADAGKHFRLTDNITLPASDMGNFGNHTQIGTNINRFRGHFDGNNKTISNLTINNTNSYYVGLFGCVENGTIQNLGLINVTINGGEGIGGVAGHITGSNASITGCYVTGSVNGNIEVGGITGVVNDGATISNNYTTCTVSGTESQGGIAGIILSLGSSVNNCYATGAITGTLGIGGIAGANFGTVSNCYATGAITGTDRVGGIIGFNEHGTVRNCVALNVGVNREGSVSTGLGRVVGFIVGSSATLTNNAAFNGMTTNSGLIFADSTVNGMGITKEAAKTQNNYVLLGWGFGTTATSPWKMGVGTYLLPVFHWQTTAPIALPLHLN